MAMRSRTGQTGGSDSVSTTTPLAFGGAGSDGGRWAASVVLCNPHVRAVGASHGASTPRAARPSGLGSRLGLHVDHGAPGASVQSRGLGRRLASMPPDGSACWAASTSRRVAGTEGRQACSPVAGASSPVGQAFFRLGKHSASMLRPPLEAGSLGRKAGRPAVP